MLPKPTDAGDADQPMLSSQQLNDYRYDQQNFLQWRYDSSVEADYYDGNQYSNEDRAQMGPLGIPMVTINRIKKQINDVIGLQESNMTNWKLHSEDILQDDVVAAWNAKLKIAERMSNADRSCLGAFKSMAKSGIGWVEVGRERNPFRYGIRTDPVPWREMWWDYRARKLDLSDASHIRRGRFYPVAKLVQSFPMKASEIINAQWSNDIFRIWVEPDQNVRQYDRRNNRDLPRSWNTSFTAQKDQRFIEEVWYPVNLEGPVVRFNNTGRVMKYEDALRSPMTRLALQSGMAFVEENQAYQRWRQSFWIGDTCILDRWSPLPFDGPPYTPFWCYQEDQTGVPYGLIRDLRSIQDAINTMESKIILSLNAKQVKFKEGSTDPVMLAQQVGMKNGMIPIREGYQLTDVEIKEHTEVNEQQFKLYADLLQQIEIVGGTAGLNPASMSAGKPRSGTLANQMMLRAMATLGEMGANYQESRTLVGYKVLELVREDITKRGASVEIKTNVGERKTVQLHQQVGETPDGSPIISNDATLLHANVVLDDVPQTATYRAQQFEIIAGVLQSMPPEAVQLRAMMLAELVECSDLPGAADKAQMMREQSGLVPPRTPEAKAAAQQQQQRNEQDRQLQVDTAMSQIDLNKAKALKERAGAQHNMVLAQTEATGGAGEPPEDPTDRLLEQEKKTAQIIQIRAKAEHTMNQTQDLQRQAAVPRTW